MCVFCTHYTMVFAGSATSAIAIPSSDGSSSLSSTSQSTLVLGISLASGASAGELYKVLAAAISSYPSSLGTEEDSRSASKIVPALFNPLYLYYTARIEGLNLLKTSLKVSNEIVQSRG